MKGNKMSEVHDQIVGLIPCAGFANRLPSIPCSKEIYPVSYGKDLLKPKVISSYLLEQFYITGAETAYMIIRKGKWDIPNYYGLGEDYGIYLSYVVVNPTKGTSYTVDRAFPFLKGKRVLFGFPDIYFEPKGAFKKLLAHQAETNSDVVLGLFKAHKSQSVDMVQVNNKGVVNKIQVKPEKSQNKYTWMIAVWTHCFTDYLHNYMSELENEGIQQNTDEIEIHIGHVLQRSIEDGLKINSVKFPKGSYIDIGTPEDLKRAMKIIR